MDRMKEIETPFYEENKERGTAIGTGMYYFDLLSYYHNNYGITYLEEEKSFSGEEVTHSLYFGKYSYDYDPSVNVISKYNVLQELHVKDFEVDSSLEKKLEIEKDIAYELEGEYEMQNANVVELNYKKEEGKMAVLKRDADFGDKIDILEKSGRLKSHFFQSDLINDLMDKGLQPYNLERGFEEVDMKEGANPTYEGFREFEWYTNSGDKVVVPYRTFYHESMEQEVIVVNDEALSNQLESSYQKSLTKGKKSNKDNEQDLEK